MLYVKYISIKKKKKLMTHSFELKHQVILLFLEQQKIENGNA